MEDKFQCDPEHCKSHEYVVKTMDRLELLTTELTKSHIDLVAAVRDIAELGRRVAQLETNQDTLKNWRWKITGFVSAIAFIIPLAVTVALQFL